MKPQTSIKPLGNEILPKLEYDNVKNRNSNHLVLCWGLLKQRKNLKVLKNRQSSKAWVLPVSLKFKFEILVKRSSGLVLTKTQIKIMGSK